MHYFNDSSSPVLAVSSPPGDGNGCVQQFGMEEYKTWQTRPIDFLAFINTHQNFKAA
jgi:hypothetical protein